MKLEITRSKPGKFTNLWKLSNTLFNGQKIKKESAREIGKYL